MIFEEIPSVVPPVVFATCFTWLQVDTGAKSSACAGDQYAPDRGCWILDEIEARLAGGNNFSRRVSLLSRAAAKRLSRQLLALEAGFRAESGMRLQFAMRVGFYVIA